MPELMYNEFCRCDSVREILNHNDFSNCISRVRRCGACNDRRRRPQKSPRRNVKCNRRDNSQKQCTHKIEQLALPKLSLAEYTLQRYSYCMYPERVINLCKLIQELRKPQPKPVNAWKGKSKQCRKPNRKRCKTRKLCELWLKQQTNNSADIFGKYINSLRPYIPNYKELLVTSRMYKALEFEKLCTKNRYVKQELKKICDKLAVLIDTKLEPYKQALRVETIPSLSDLEDKHVVFKMFDFEYESETEIEELSEEETPYPKSLYEMSTVPFEEDIFQEEMVISMQKEFEAILAEIESKAVFEEEKELQQEEREELQQEEGEELQQDIIVEEESFPIIQGEGAEELQEVSLLLFNEMEAELEEAEFIRMLQEEEERASLYVAELHELLPEEETFMEEIEEEELDYHHDGTSSYVDWCLYVSWLKELSSNIEIYANCLQKFRCVLARDDANKHNDMLKFLLNNWCKYLADSRRIDTEMTKYFKDKPMTWCTKCRDCSIDDYPRDHFIPPELESAIGMTKEWRRLLAEADDACRRLCAESAEAESEEEVSEVYDIYDVATSSSSGFDIVIT